MSLTTLLGSAQLSMQNAIAAGVTIADGVAVTPNFLLLSVRRESFLRQYPGDLTQELERLRRELQEGLKGFLMSHGWRVGGNGSMTINILLRSIPDECTVQASTVDRLYDLLIADSDGSRTVPVKLSPVMVGRSHAGQPRGFIPVEDRSRLVSREHLLLEYRDLHLTGRLLGRNPTTINGAPLGQELQELHRGDRVVCGGCAIEIGEIR